MGRRKVKDEEKQKPSGCPWFIDPWMFEFSSVLCSHPKKCSEISGHFCSAKARTRLVTLFWKHYSFSQYRKRREALKKKLHKPCCISCSDVLFHPVLDGCS